ncbi:MAG: hypothetical protein JST32_02060 [Bacteroidetes bacterium]|nr:hypothetical protein [Bacteroidota bacterium]
MHNLYRLLLLVFIACGWTACKSNGNYLPVPNDAKSLIVGKWILQQQKFVQYVDGVKKADTILNATPFSLAFVRFNSDGTFSSSSIYSSGNSAGLGGGITNVSDDSNGTYAFSGAVFSVSAPIAGFGNGSNTLVLGTSGSIPVVTPISNSIKIVELTPSKMNLHTEYVYTYTVNNISQTYKIGNDYYYSK